MASKRESSKWRNRDEMRIADNGEEREAVCDDERRLIDLLVASYCAESHSAESSVPQNMDTKDEFMHCRKAEVREADSIRPRHVIILSFGYMTEFRR